MGRKALLSVQLAAIVVLVVGTVLTLWSAGEDAAARDRRRTRVRSMLAQADDAIAIRGASGLDLVPEWPDSLEPEDWDVLDLWLSYEAEEALDGMPEVGGGFYVPSIDRYLGHAGATKTATGTRERGRPERERELIDDQVKEALELDRPVDRVVEMSTRSVAVRAAPLRVNGRRVAATWVLATLDEANPLGRSARSYQRASWLALGGLVLALVLSASLAMTLRALSIDRARMELEARRGERLAALGTLLAGVSHEMRNPLAGLRSAAQLWRRGIVGDDELWAEIESEVDRLDALVGDLLIFSRSDTKSLTPGDVNAVVTEAGRLAASIGEPRGIVVELDVPTEAAIAEIDGPSFLRVLRNLTGNAIQAMPEGGRLRLACRRDHSAGTIAVTVSDTGAGISPEVAQHLFEPFFTTRAEGTGLGLAIAREIVLAHRGSIHAESLTGGGARFVVSLPESRGAIT